MNFVYLIAGFVMIIGIAYNVFGTSTNDHLQALGFLLNAVCLFLIVIIDLLRERGNEKE